MSTPRPLIVVGAGGFGREVADLVRQVNAVDPRFDLVGLAADTVPDGDVLQRAGLRFVGSVEDAVGAEGTAYVVAVGDPGARGALAARADAVGLEPVTLVHPTAVVGSDVEIAAGGMLCAGTVVTTHVRIGRHALVNLGCTIGHDVVLGDVVSLMPGVHLSGGSALGDGVYVGTGAVVLPGVHLGAGAVVGAAACVTSDVPAATTVVGVPARPRTR